MTEAKFTKGPWRISAQLNSLWITNTSTDGNGEDNSRIIAATSRGMGLSQEAKANARLIAAAPELFDRLEMTTDTLRILAKLQNGMSAETRQALKERVEANEAVLAKATETEAAV